LISIELDIKFENTEGVNLTNSESGINVGNITVSYFTNGVWHPVANEPIPIEREGEQHIRLFLNPEANDENTSETRIDFLSGESDIIKAELSTSSNSILLEKVWYNEVMKWDVDQRTERVITVVK
jgi:hypothetical protein